MTKYELVVLLDPKLSKTKFDSTINKLEEIVSKGNLLEKDDIGILELVTEIKGNMKAYFISYYLDLDDALITEIQKELKFTKEILRSALYKMGSKEKFLKFKDINKMFELTQEEKKLKENEKAFQDMDTISKIKK